MVGCGVKYLAQKILHGLLLPTGNGFARFTVALLDA